MRRPDQTEADPTVARELAELEAALRGGSADPALNDLVREVRAQRAEPGEAFRRELDERVRAGFPRRRSALGAGLRARARALRGTLGTRRMLLPAMGSAAALLLAVVVGASLLPSGGGSEETTTGLAAPQDGGAKREAGGGSAAQAPEETSGVATAPGTTDVAPGRRDRRVEREAQLTLSAAPDQIGDLADDVIAVTDRIGGIVVSSSVQSRGGGGASFELRVPSARLREALGLYSKLAHVESRTENAQDVTQAFLTIQERLDELTAERRGLLRQLATADTRNQTESLRARLRLANGEIASLRTQLNRARERTDFARVAVAIEPGTESAAGGSGTWTPGDAVQTARRIFEVLGAAAVLALAIIAPLALLALLAAGSLRIARRRRREQALSSSS